MKFSDIVSLAKAGFSPSDVREFLKAAESEPEEKKSGEPKKDPEPEPEHNPKEKAATPEDPPRSEDKKPSTEIDYKAKYEEAQEALRLAQAANNQQNIDIKPDKTADEILEDFLRDYT